jgi:hypothetical protein
MSAAVDDPQSRQMTIGREKVVPPTEFECWLGPLRHPSKCSSRLKEVGLGAVLHRAHVGRTFIDRMDQNQSITARFLDDRDFRGAVSRYLLKQVYEQIRGEAMAV